MNKRLFNKVLKDITEKCEECWTDVELTERDTTNFRYPNYLSFTLNSQDWATDIDYARTNHDTLLQPKDRTLNLFFYVVNQNGDKVHKAIFVSYNDNYDNVIDYTISVTVSVNQVVVADYNKRCVADSISLELYNTMFRSR